ncbi:hypothetical protein [Microcystis phage MJing1]|nr:hypothetical protein [Microcystis phage MJing1]
MRMSEGVRWHLELAARTAGNVIVPMLVLFCVTVGFCLSALAGVWLMGATLTEEGRVGAIVTGLFLGVFAACGCALARDR